MSQLIYIKNFKKYHPNLTILTFKDIDGINIPNTNANKDTNSAMGEYYDYNHNYKDMNMTTLRLIEDCRCSLSFHNKKNY